MQHSIYSGYSNDAGSDKCRKNRENSLDRGGSERQAAFGNAPGHQVHKGITTDTSAQCHFCHLCVPTDLKNTGLIRQHFQHQFPCSSFSPPDAEIAVYFVVDGGGAVHISQVAAFGDG